MRGRPSRASDFWTLALRPPGIVALFTLVVDIGAFLLVASTRLAVLMVIIAVLAGLVLGWCIGRGIGGR